jgi:hypothetical protein
MDNLDTDNINIGHTRHRMKKDKQKTKTKTTQKTKNMSNKDTTKNPKVNPGVPKGKKFLSLIKHPPYYSFSQDMLDTTIPKQTQMT